LKDIKLELKPPVESPLMVQPPADDQLRDAALCHYTWETLVEENGEEIWIFDKRKYTAAEMELKVSHFCFLSIGSHPSIHPSIMPSHLNLYKCNVKVQFSRRLRVFW
jgi:hypothetical protein